MAKLVKIENLILYGEWGCSSAWLECMPVTHEVAGSSPVSPAIKIKRGLLSSLYFCDECGLRTRTKRSFVAEFERDRAEAEDVSEG